MGKAEKIVGKALDLTANAVSNVRAGLISAKTTLENLLAAQPGLEAVIAPKIAALEKDIAALDAVSAGGGPVQALVTAAGEIMALPKTGITPESHPADVTGG